jgi:membrane fusion protein, multidrug efflux system
VTTTERVFVIRDANGHAQWVNVHKRPTVGTPIEVQGDLKPGDEVVDHATDEIRDGTDLNNSKS